jgi:hypothetical protein
MLKHPFVFIFNILESQHAVFRTSLFNHIRWIFEQDNQKCIFMPIRNSAHSTLEHRAEIIDKKLRNIGSAHIVALSVSGVDCRMALSSYSTPMESLFTISSPHNGSTLATWAYSPERDLSLLDPICKFLGIPFDAFIEMRTDRIQKINKKLPQVNTPICSTSLQGKDDLLVKWNDGVFYVDEMKWGNHLLSFDGDHTEILGSNLKINCAPLYRLALDNAKRFELHQEGKVVN